MEMLLLTREDIILPEFTIKYEDPILFRKLVMYIKKYGQLQPITVCERSNNYQIIKGMTIMKACQEAGIKEFYCINLGELRDDEIALHSICLNVFSREQDIVKLTKIINKVLETKTIAEISSETPYSVQELQAFQKALTFNWDQYDEPKEQIKMDLI
jgi:ParB-like chromosome segregation protein Spo0J